MIGGYFVEKVNDLKEMVKVQGTDGNWNYNEYMFGMYNGMEYALAMMENRQPQCKDKPDKWLQNG